MLGGVSGAAPAVCVLVSGYPFPPSTLRPKEEKKHNGDTSEIVIVLEASYRGFEPLCNSAPLHLSIEMTF